MNLLKLFVLSIFTILAFLITGCSTTAPVVAKFPEQPSKIAMEKCPNLQKLKEDAKLSDISNTISINYSTYYECAVKLDTWIEWYQIQKNIFEGVK